MKFLRLAGCSVGCSGCDTDYSVFRKISIGDLVSELDELGGCRVVWVTGGEPSDLPVQNQHALVDALSLAGYRVCVATSGVKKFAPADRVFLSVSPHSADFLQRRGSELKVVDGLNGLDLHQFDGEFQFKYVQPLSRESGGIWSQDNNSFRRCLEFVLEYPDWSLSEQRHHAWGIK